MGRQRYWDGREWTGDVAVGPHATAPPVTPANPPRGVWLRVLLTVVSWIGVYLLAGVASAVFAPATEDPGVVSVLVLLAIYGFLAPKVSYRWFDCLFILIPIYGIYWSFRILWRVAFLPYRDWIPRPSEALTWAPVAGTPSATRPLYVVRHP